MHGREIENGTERSETGRDGEERHAGKENGMDRW